MSAFAVVVKSDDGTSTHYGPLSELMAWRAADALMCLSSVESADVRPLVPAAELTASLPDWRRSGDTGRMSSGDSR